jgi:acetyltransferase-like isoleucine patch superfamily enzyme
MPPGLSRRLIARVRPWAYRLTAARISLGAVLFGPPRLLRHHTAVNELVLRRFGAAVGQGVRLHAPITLHAAEDGYGNLVIGDDVILNGNNYLDLSGRIVLGNGVSLGPGVVINTHNWFNHNEFLETVLARDCGVRDVRIGDGTGVKANATVLMGVTIGVNCVIARGTVVNRDVPDRSFVADVAKTVRSRIGEPEAPV